MEEQYKVYETEDGNWVVVDMDLYNLLGKDSGESYLDYAVSQHSSEAEAKKALGSL